ncbi:MAG: hypothetical protein HXY41_10480 [Chloroflexi bacterium]|nr:hypothetical protein [Chloroflexota bacterium]
MEISRPRIAALFAALTVIGALLLFQPVAAFVAYQDVDYNNHLGYLRLALNGGSLLELLSYIPHFLFFLLVAGLHSAGLSLNDAALWVAVGAYTAGTWAIFWLLCRFAGEPGTLLQGIVYFLASLAGMLVMPFNLLTPSNLYLGYVVIHAYHNPTITLLKPFALPVFWFAAKAFTPSAQDEPAGFKALWGVALLAALSVMAKSSYALALLPALTLPMALSLFRRRAVNWRLLAAVVLPMVAALAAQAVLFRNTGGIVFAPLAVIHHWADRINPQADADLPLKLAASILFPAAVYLLYRREAAQNVHLNLAWLAFVFGAAYMFLLAESGDRLGHANFTWSAQVALFVLFAASLAFLVRQAWLRRSPALFAALAALALHVVSGLNWYAIHVNAVHMGDIIANLW